EVRRRAQALSHARRGHGPGDHRHLDGRGHGDRKRRGPPGDHRPSRHGRSGLSCRLPRMERADPVLWSGAIEDDRRVGRVGAVRHRHDRRALVPGRLRRLVDDQPTRRLTGRMILAPAVFVTLLTVGAPDLAHEADRRIARVDTTADTRVAIGRKFLEAIWRYYNLVDFAVATRDNAASVAVRLAFDEAETYVKPAAGGTAPADPTGLRKPLQRIAQVLSTLIESSSTPSSSTPPRRNS